jgi:hypothetical protein
MYQHHSFHPHLLTNVHCSIIRGWDRSLQPTRHCNSNVSLNLSTYNHNYKYKPNSTTQDRKSSETQDPQPIMVLLGGQPRHHDTTLCLYSNPSLATPRFCFAHLHQLSSPLRDHSSSTTNQKATHSRTQYPTHYWVITQTLE